MAPKEYRYAKIHCPCILRCTIHHVSKYDCAYSEKRYKHRRESTVPMTSKLATWLSHIFGFYSILGYQNIASRLFQGVWRSYYGL